MERIVSGRKVNFCTVVNQGMQFERALLAVTKDQITIGSVYRLRHRQMTERREILASSICDAKTETRRLATFGADLHSNPRRTWKGLASSMVSIDQQGCKNRQQRETLRHQCFFHESPQ